MVAFLVAGVILGALARFLWRGEGDPGAALTLLAGVVGAVVGGVGMNLVLDDPAMSVGAWSFTAACILPLVLLGMLEGGVGRRAS